MALRAEVVLSGEERETLERWARRPKSSQALAFRCRIVLAAAEGRSSIAEMTPRHRAEEFRRFLNLIDTSVPAHLDVHVVLDNSSTHKTPSIQRWLVRHPRFTFHFTPTYSSWLNLVERWFAELTTKWIKRGAHRSVRDLVASIRTWITNWNDEPKPFVWHKSADQILDSLAAYCQRIDDSGH